MIKTKYVPIWGINDVQISIMNFVTQWIHEQNTPIPQHEIVLRMMEVKISEPSTVDALKQLIRKGYLRKAYTITNKTSYVKLRGI